MAKDKSESKRYVEYWKKLNPDWTDEMCKEAVAKHKRECNYQCIEYYIKKYPNLTLEECEEKRKETINSKKENCEVKIEYWIKRYPDKSIDELEKMRENAANAQNKCNIEYWIKKYPNKDIEELKKMHEEHYNKWKANQKGWGSGENNINSKKKVSSSVRNSRSPRNIEFYERKYPELTHEEHVKMRDEFFEKNRLAVKNTIKDTNIEWYLNKGMTMEEAKEALRKRQTTFSFEKCIEKYGEENGEKIWAERQQKWLNSIYKTFQKNGVGRSKQSIFAKIIIAKCCEALNIEIPNYEKYLYDKINKRSYAFDFMIKNKIIEFNGDYWHANPELYDENYFNKAKNKTAKEIWEYDKAKIECAKSYGFDVLIVWENDYNYNEDEVIKKCIDFLKS